MGLLAPEVSHSLLLSSASLFLLSRFLLGRCLSFQHLAKRLGEISKKMELILRKMNDLTLKIAHV
jgi:hypothetical protein